MTNVGKLVQNRLEDLRATPWIAQDEDILRASAQAHVEVMLVLARHAPGSPLLNATDEEVAAAILATLGVDGVD